MNHTFPYLYNKTEKGKWRYWRILLKVTPKAEGYLWTEYGEEGGKKTTTQPKKITYKSPHNSKKMYKKLYQLAETKWENKKKMGYHESKKASLSSNVIIPMRTQNFTKASHHIKYPAYVQVKYDGYRALTDLDKMRVISRQGNPLENVNDILKEIKARVPKKYQKKGVYFDGELFLPEGIHQLKSIISKKGNHNVQYYIFDMIDLEHPEMTFEDRWKMLQTIFHSKPSMPSMPSKLEGNIHLADTRLVKSKEDVEKLLQEFLEAGHEGLVVRNREGLYRPNARSANVQKLIQVKRGTFEIVGYKEGDKGQVVWQIKCQKSERTFWAMPMGTQEYRRQLYKNASQHIGEKVQVKYFAVDEDGCVTRNPVVVMK